MCCWPDEMPDEKEYQNARTNLERKGYSVDYILTHTAPVDTIEYMSRMNRDIKNSGTEEAALNTFLSWVEGVVDYDKWYFGHFHQDRDINGSVTVLYDEVIEIDEHQ